MTGIKKRLGSLMGPRGYNSTDAAEDIATLASYTRATAGTNEFRDALYSVTARQAANAVSQDPGVVAQAAALAVQDVGLAGVRPGKNLVNPNEIAEGWYIGGDGLIRELEHFATTGFIPVKSGVSYTSSKTTNYAFYDTDKNPIPGTRESAPVSNGVHTVVAPADGFLRVDAHSVIPNWQIEVGDTATRFLPYRMELDNITIPARYIVYDDEHDDEYAQKGQVFSRSGHQLSVETTLGSQGLTIQSSLRGGPGGVFDWGRVSTGSDIITTSGDDVSPVTTQQGMVGGNHGLHNTFVWPTGHHDKTTADLGSRWRDSASGEEFALLQISNNGDLLLAAKYGINPDGSYYAPRTRPVSLEHISGATNTSPIMPLDVAAENRQLYPSIQRLNQRVTVDGVEFSSGQVTGVEMRIQETYDIMDYASLYDQATANVGVPYEDLHIEAAIRNESEWRIRPHGKIVGEVNLTEMKPTQLKSWFGLQARATYGDVIRWLPGVKPIDGLDWSAGVPISDLTEIRDVTTADLHHPSYPPSVLIDVTSNYAVAIGIDPWYEDGSVSSRVENTPDALWYLYPSTKKIYPRVLRNKEPGWGRVSIRGIRHYLTVDEAERALSSPTDTLLAWSVLDTLH